MTPETIQALIAASAPLVENPLPWKDLSENQKDLFSKLMPNPSFDENQRFYLSLWWLPVTEEELEVINELAPRGTRFSARDGGDGKQYLCSDILSDTINGGRLKDLLSILETLPLTYRPEEVWPVPPAEEE